MPRRRREIKMRIYILSSLLLTSFLGSANAIKIVNLETSTTEAGSVNNRSIEIEIFAANGATCDSSIMATTLIKDTLVGPGGTYEFIESAKRPLIDVVRVKPENVCIRIEGFTGRVPTKLVKNKGCTITVQNAGAGQGIQTTEENCKVV